MKALAIICVYTSKSKVWFVSNDFPLTVPIAVLDKFNNHNVTILEIGMETALYKKIKSFIKDFFSKVTKSVVYCGFGYIYLRSP